MSHDRARTTDDFAAGASAREDDSTVAQAADADPATGPMTQAGAATPHSTAGGTSAAPTSEKDAATASTGFFEGLVGMDAVGWANVGAEGEVVLIVDDRTVACGPANRFRADVLEAGIGTGHHGFQIALPPELLDGRSHRIRVQAGPDGRTIEPGEREFKLPRAVHGAIERVDGAFVTGWAAEDVAPGKPLPVELRVDGTAVAIGAADQPGAQGMRSASSRASQ